MSKSKYWIRERCGRFDVRTEVWVDGSRRTISGGTHDTREAAEAKGRDLVSKYHGSNTTAAHAELANTTTLAEWAPVWLKGLPGKVKTSTAATHEWRMKEWVLPGLGKLRLLALQRDVIARWVDGLPLAAPSKRAALTTLSSCLTAAVRAGKLQENLCKGVVVEESRALSRQRQQGRVKVWSPDQLESLLRASRGLPVEAAVVLGAYGGLRRGEILGVEWGDLDWLAGKVLVARQVVATPQGLLRNETPKSGVSRRVSLAPAAVDVLGRLEGATGAQGRILGEMTPRQLQSRFNAACTAAGVPLLGLHALRHSAASLLLSQGVSIVAVAAHLGHSNPTVTLSTYAHLMPADEIICAEVLQRSLPIHSNQPEQAVA